MNDSRFSQVLQFNCRIILIATRFWSSFLSRFILSDPGAFGGVLNERIKMERQAVTERNDRFTNKRQLLAKSLIATSSRPTSLSAPAPGLGR